MATRLGATRVRRQPRAARPSALLPAGSQTPRPASLHHSFHRRGGGGDAGVHQIEPGAGTKVGGWPAACALSCPFPPFSSHQLVTPPSFPPPAHAGRDPPPSRWQQPTPSSQCRWQRAPREGPPRQQRRARPPPRGRDAPPLRHSGGDVGGRTGSAMLHSLQQQPRRIACIERDHASAMLDEARRGR